MPDGKAEDRTEEAGDADEAEQLARTHNSAEVERLLAESVKEKSAAAGRDSPG